MPDAFDQRDFVFAHPWVLFFLFAIPFLLLLRGRRGPETAIRFSSIEVLKALGPDAKPRAGGFSRLLTLLAIASAVVALARPQFQRTLREDKASGVDIMVALDISGSMRVDDFHIDGRSVNRLVVAKRSLLDFIDQRPDDRIGLTVFAGRPYPSCPLTLDHSTLRDRVRKTAIAGRGVEQGTAIGLAMASVVRQLDSRKFKSKVAVLLTDGESKWGLDPLEAAKIAKTLGVKVYTIGVGTNRASPIPGVSSVPRKEFDEESLKKIARLTNAKYFQAGSTKSMEGVFREIDHLEKSEVLRRTTIESEDLWKWPGGTSLAALTAGCLFGLTIGRRVP